MLYAPRHAKRRRVRALALLSSSMTLFALLCVLIAGPAVSTPGDQSPRTSASLLKVYEDFWANYRFVPLDAERESRINRL